MLARLKRNIDAGRHAEAPRPHARGDDDVLGGHFAARRRNADRATVLGQDRGDLDIFEHFGAALIVAPLIKRHRRVDRVGLAVAGQEHAANDIPDVQQRPMPA